MTVEEMRKECLRLSAIAPKAETDEGMMLMSECSTKYLLTAEICSRLDTIIEGMGDGRRPGRVNFVGDYGEPGKGRMK